MRASSGFTRGGVSRRCETWIVLELCSLGSLQVRSASALRTAVLYSGSQAEGCDGRAHDKACATRY